MYPNSKNCDLKKGGVPKIIKVWQKEGTELN